MSRMNLSSLPPKPELLDALRRAAGRKMTPAEVAAQRRSYVRAEIGFGSDADEAAYRAALVAGSTAALARLEAEAQARMAAFDAETREG